MPRAEKEVKGMIERIAMLFWGTLKKVAVTSLIRHRESH